MLPDEAELASSGRPWCKIKTSTLKKSDIPMIKDKGGMTDSFEVVIPEMGDRAHRLPTGFHTFSLTNSTVGLSLATGTIHLIVLALFLATD
ncbi:hypothetical protein F511_21743 [Dorcoceras hygrometricum]|uniref:Uncharacterized protein n=1 Tax=Dorcoceras hygrometricum TaxID=472368 RepID=A0A2Z7BQ63_9LAMI|nr:hypothetical protein F511_21743 [Dorcoceras hygrometricum]